MEPKMTGSSSTPIKREPQETEIRDKEKSRSNNNEPDTSSKSKSSRRTSPPRDDEPTTTKAPSSSEGRESTSSSRPETVDRGVGPTPAPPILPHEPRGAFFHIPPYPDPRDPRNGLVAEHHLSAYPFAYPHLPYHHINPPLPVNAHTHEGRYQWPPTSFAQPSHGLSGSPAYSDLSLINMHSRSPGGESMSPLLAASRLHLEQYRRMFPVSSMSNRGFSPTSLSGLSAGAFLPHPSSTPFSQRSLYGEIPPTPGSGSITLPGSLDSSRLTSPRPSLIGKNSRKRTLSHSPFSECGLDIESLTRSSEGSLQLTPFAHSRSSSAASGSYGHLSAGSLGPSPAGFPSHPFMRHAGFASSPLFPPMIHPLLARQHTAGTVLPPTQPLAQSHGATKLDPQIPPPVRQDPSSSSVVSSTVDPQNDSKKHKYKKESSDMRSDEDGKYGDPSRVPVEGEPDFIETNCHWKDCKKEFDTQDELVRHINQDHIQANKKSFVCLWDECSREAKPFKAQYMLVVHMRRHTGEKPHNCTFEGCNKAYSRLENLKTHLRSHTGEKPYMCEYPGCTKAFSNASDRAKHQNRTHSNAKPYVCKAPGCSKRYTDPSSLRKHVKTVHGPEFYANKKHKGVEPPGGGSDRGEGDNPDGGKSIKMEDSDSCDKTENPSSVESQQTQHNPSTESKMEHSPASTHSNYSDLDDRLPAQIPTSIGGNPLEEEEDEDDDDELVLPATTVSVATTGALRASRGMAPNRIKGRLSGKAVISNLPTLPPIGPRPVHTTITDLNDKHGPKHSTHHRRLTDIISQNSSQDGSVSFNSRRDSNTSTLSSYFSSIRSDESPYPFNSSFASRRSSESSHVPDNRLSISNSPYEYDISGNFPSATSRRQSDNQSVTTVTSQMERAKLGSQSSLNFPKHLPPVGTHSRASSERNSRTSSCRREREREQGWTRNSTPCRTPLPHEVPNRDVRRASDPIRSADPNFSALKQLQRYHSWNQSKPLPLPDGMKSLKDQAKADSGQNFSSWSSIATDYSFQDDPDGSQILSESIALRSVDEESLDIKMMEDNEDMLIPDDMQRFLNEQYHHTIGAQQADSTVPDYSQQDSPGHGHPQRPGSNSMAAQGSPFNVAQASPKPRRCMHHSSMTASWNSSQMPDDDKESIQSCNSCRQSQGGYIPSFHQPTPPPGTPMARHNMRRRMVPSQMSGQMTPSSQISEQMSHTMASAQMPPPPPPQQQPMSPQQQHLSPPQQQQQHMSPQEHQLTPPQPYPTQMHPHMQGGYMQSGQMAIGGSPNMHPGLMPQQHQPVYGPYPNMMGSVPHSPNYNNPWPQQEMQGPVQGPVIQPPYPVGPYYGPHPFNHPQHQHMHPQMMGNGPKEERASPQVQVAQISQSQVPPRSKEVSSERHYPPQQIGAQQQQQMQHPHQQHPQQMYGGPGPNDMMSPPQGYPGYHQYQMHGNMAVQQMVPPYPPGQPMPMGPPAAAGSYAQQQQQQQQQQQTQQQHHHQLQQQHQQQQQQHQRRHHHQPHHPQQRPSCQMVPGAGNSVLEMQMSPDCNRVSSTTDVKECQTDIDFDASMASGLNSISADNIIDNLSSISMENLHGNIISPTALINRSASQTSSRMTTPYMEGKASSQSGAILDTSNMVVNDMSSMLTQLAEENRYLNSSFR